MATYTITPSDVSNGLGTLYTAGEEIEAGEFVYLDKSAEVKAKLAVNTSEATAKVEGIALNHAYEGQPVSVKNSGTVETGTIPTGPEQGQLLVVSDTAGKAMDVNDLSDGDYVSVIGWHDGTTTLTIDMIVTNTTLVVT